MFIVECAVSISLYLCLGLLLLTTTGVWNGRLSTLAL